MHDDPFWKNSPRDALVPRSKTLHDSTDVEVRYDAAWTMLRVDEHDEALLHYLWLWPATRAVDAYGGVRVSFMLAGMALLAAKHEPARKAFAEILEGLQARVEAEKIPTLQDWREWSAFCRSFGAKERVLAWYQAHRDGAGRLFAGTPEFRTRQIVADVHDALMEEGRLADAVRLYEDARERARAGVELHRMMMPRADMNEEHRERLAMHLCADLTQNLSKLFAALHAAERDAEATDVAALLLKTLDTPEARLALVEQALGASKRPHASFERWLDEAEAAGKDVKSLRRKL